MGEIRQDGLIVAKHIRQSKLAMLADAKGNFTVEWEIPSEASSSAIHCLLLCKVHQYRRESPLKLNYKC